MYPQTLRGLLHGSRLALPRSFCRKHLISAAVCHGRALHRGAPDRKDARPQCSRIASGLAKTSTFRPDTTVPLHPGSVSCSTNRRGARPPRATHSRRCVSSLQQLAPAPAEGLSLSTDTVYCVLFLMSRSPAPTSIDMGGGCPCRRLSRH
jgi:hypothetical protein